MTAVAGYMQAFTSHTQAITTGFTCCVEAPAIQCSGSETLKLQQEGDLQHGGGKLDPTAAELQR